MSAASSAITTHTHTHTHTSSQMDTLLAHGVHNSHADTQAEIQRDTQSEIQIQAALQILKQWSTLHQFQYRCERVCVCASRKVCLWH